MSGLAIITGVTLAAIGIPIMARARRKRFALLGGGMLFLGLVTLFCGFSLAT